MESFPESKILIVDDEPAARYGMRKALNILKAEIREAEDGEEALRQIAEFDPDVVVCDVNMPKLNGLELLKQLAELPTCDKKRQIIVVTAYGSEKIAVEAMKAGAYDYLSKPYDIDELRLVVNKALENVRLQQENARLRQQVAGTAKLPVIGESSVVQHLNKLIEKVAPTDVTVLLTGESGTGKELAARTIHSLSLRATGPYITMNCAAIPRDLVESELFGHEKGAFTGAGAQRQGKFELAHSGTLFLDEIADMSLETQAKILRVLEDKTFTRLGGKQVITADVRLISATNKELEKEIELGKFRQDLYYRLKVFEIKLPPLSQRKEDIPLLVNHYIKQLADRHHQAVYGIDAAAMRALLEYSWPGNVRELIHVLEQSIVLAEGEKLTLADLPAEVRDNKSPSQPLNRSPHIGESSFTEMKGQLVEEFEQEVIYAALSQSNGNVSQAARLLKMKRQYLQAKMKSLSIRAEDVKKERSRLKY